MATLCFNSQREDDNKDCALVEGLGCASHAALLPERVLYCCITPRTGGARRIRRLGSNFCHMCKTASSQSEEGTPAWLACVYMIICCYCCVRDGRYQLSSAGKR